MKKTAWALIFGASFTYSALVHASQSNSVNFGSAVAMYDVPLFSISQSPLSVSFKLSYHSQDPVRPTLTYLPMGLGWTHSFNETLLPTDATSAVLYRITPEGWEEEYTTDGTGHWSASSPAEIRGTVTLASNEYTVTDMNGLKTVFDGQTGSATFGRWKRTVDRWGNTITGAYSVADLTSITDSVGRVLTLSYASGQLTQILLPGGGTWKMQYTNGLLIGLFDPIHSGSVAWRTFSYQNNALGIPRLLLFVLDDGNKSLQSFTYDATDRATSASSEGGTDLMTIQYDVPAAFQTRVTRTQSTGVNLVTDYTLVYQGARWLVTKSDGGCTSCGASGADTSIYQWFADNHLQAKILGVDRTGSGGTDERAETDYTYDGNGMMLSKTEAIGTIGNPQVRTTNYAYGYASGTPNGGNPWPSFMTAMTEASVVKSAPKTTSYAWNSTGTPETTLTMTVAGFVSPSDPGTTYTTSTSFDANHRTTEVDGPVTGAKTTSTYYSNADATLNRRGRPQTSSLYTSSTAHLDTTYDNYDVFGTAHKTLDPNGAQTYRRTDAVGRITGVTLSDPVRDPDQRAYYSTTYWYDSRDRLEHVTFPLFNRIQYLYEDGTNRLTDTIRVDALVHQREGLHLTLNAIGGKVAEQARSCDSPILSCAAWTTQRSDSFTYDTHNRLSATIHPADATQVNYTYDTRGNLLTVQDERHATANTVYGYDFLNRLRTVTQHQTLVSGPDVVTQYVYDTQDNLTSVTDPNGNITSYVYDDFRQMQTQTSPVTGTTTYSYDPAGNLLTSTDANGATTTRTYDVANRITGATSTGPSTPETVTWTYDNATAGAYGMGRLATMTDPSGSATYAYDLRGLLRSEGRTIQGNGYSLAYGYDANGNRSSITYPSGAVVKYGFDFADRPLSAAPGATGATAYVSSASYAPFGPETQIVYGNGTTKTVTYDQRYHPLENKLVAGATTLADYVYQEDAAGNITQIHDGLNAAYNRDFGYDDLNRVTTANSGTSLWGTATGNGYAYDLMGNVMSLTLGAARSATFSYLQNGLAPTKNLPKLNTVTETGTRTISYDLAGNETPSGTTYSFSTRNFLASGDGNTYTYDGRGLRTVISTTVSAGLIGPVLGKGRMAEVGVDPAVAARVSSEGVKEADGVADQTASTASRLWRPVAQMASLRFGLSGHEGRAIGFSLEGTRLEPGTAGSSFSSDRGPLVPTTALRYFFYSPEMNLLSETQLWTVTGTPPILYEYVWFNGHPVAQVDSGPPTVTHWTFTDHLGTPIIQTTSTPSVYWQAEYEPYGQVFALRTLDQHQPLRLPGQEAEQLNLGLNGATERSYNIFRWYRNGWGRYTQPDPIRFDAGDLDLYRYVLDSPIVGKDPKGLFTINANCDCAARNPKYAGTNQNGWQRIVRDTTLFCSQKLSVIKDPSVRACVAKSCGEGEIRCDVPCKPWGLWVSDSDTQGYHHWWAPRTAWICLDNALGSWVPEGHAGNTIVHEWAHGCGLSEEEEFPW